MNNWTDQGPKLILIKGKTKVFLNYIDNFDGSKLPNKLKIDNLKRIKIKLS